MGKKPAYTYEARIAEVYDGDTVTAEMDLGFRIFFTEKIRLLGINAPELKGSEKSKGKKSRDALKNLVLNKKTIITTEKDKKEKYGRYLGTIYLEENGKWICVNDWMVQHKFAVYKKY